MCGKYGSALKGVGSAGKGIRIPRLPAGSGAKIRPMKTTSVGGSRRLR